MSPGAGQTFGEGVERAGTPACTHRSREGLVDVPRVNEGARRSCNIGQVVPRWDTPDTHRQHTQNHTHTRTLGNLIPRPTACFKNAGFTTAAATSRPAEKSIEFLSISPTPSGDHPRPHRRASEPRQTPFATPTETFVQLRMAFAETAGSSLCRLLVGGVIVDENENSRAEHITSYVVKKPTSLHEAFGTQDAKETSPRCGSSQNRMIEFRSEQSIELRSTLPPTKTTSLQT